MNKIKIFFNISVLLAVFTLPAYSQVNKVAQTGLQFLKIDAGAREASMGGAGTLIGYNANAVFHNPAGLARMEFGADVSLNTTQWFADIQYHSGAAAYTLEDIGTFAVHALFADYGDDIIGTQVAANEQGYITTGKVDVNAYSFGLSYARNLSEQFTVGATVKYVGQSLGSSLMPSGETKDNKVNGLAFDFGTIFYPGWESFRFGMSIRNFAAEYEYERESFELPLQFSVGVAMDVMNLLDAKDQTLLISVDAIHPRDFSERVNFGAEYTVFNIFAIRAGYKTNHDNEGLTAGAGLFYEMADMKVKVDYAYSDMEFFDAVHRISLGFSF